MVVSIAYLGPAGTYAEDAAIAYANEVMQKTGEPPQLCPYPSIPRAIKATVAGETQLSVVPVENSIEGGVATTLDTLWQLDQLRVQQALVLPISHALISYATQLEDVQVVCAHPQALGQCQIWLEKFVPWAKLVPTSSNTEALHQLEGSKTMAAIASQRAAKIYNVPVLMHPVNDHPDNCTRFWVLSLQPSAAGTHTSLAFSVPSNLPGALVKPLQVFADRGINLSRIESRPTKRSLGDYLFFVDIESSVNEDPVKSALAELEGYTETLKIFGSYTILPVKAETQ